MYLKFNGSSLKKDKITFNREIIVNVYIVCLLKLSHYDKYINLEKCLFGAVKLTKNADISRYRYSEYGIGFDRKGAFSYPSDRFGNNTIIFGVNMSSSIHVDNKFKRFLLKLLRND